MTLEPPAPPTVPAPAIRPTPPTPPRIDKGAFSHDETPQVNRKVDTPETMAKDAVAHGAGALTKRTVDHGNDEPQKQAAPSIIDTPVNTQSDYDKGQDVLREFRELDARESKSTFNASAQIPTEQTPHITTRLNHDEGHGLFYWLFTIVFVIVAAGVFGKKFLYTGRHAKSRTSMFDSLPEKNKATADKPKPIAPPPIKPAKLPPKKDDEGNKHFEVRV